MNTGLESRLRLSICTLLSVLILACVSQAQHVPVPGNPRYVFHRVGEDIGLGTISATAMLQDATGFIWIGTQDGLLRYDGTRVKRFGTQQGIPASYIDQLLLTPKGNLIVGTVRGIVMLKDGQFVPLKVKNGLRVNPGYQFVAADGSGHVYVGTRAGILSFSEGDPSQCVEVPFPAERTPPSVEAIYTDRDGTTWFAGGKSIGKITPSGTGIVLPISGLPEGPILSLASDRDHVLWLRTASELAYLQPGKTHLEIQRPAIPNTDDAGIMVIDQTGSLVVPTVAGVYRRSANGWEVLDHSRGLTVNAVFSVMQDREGAFWIGLSGYGVERWQANTAWEGWTVAEGLPDSGIWAIARDLQMRLWVGTNSGIAMWDDGAHKWRIWRSSNGLNGDVVRAIAIASDGGIWVQTYPGALTRFDPKRLAPTKVKTPPTAPTTLFRGMDGRIWISNAQYVKAIKNAPPYEFEDVPLPPEMRGNTSHLRIVDGVLWAAGENGLMRYDGTTVRVFDKKDGLHEDYVSEIAPVNANEIWFHYEESFGLSRLRIVDGKPEIHEFTRADGLASDTTYMLGLDHRKNVWVGGPFGLTVFRPDGQVRRYNRADGLLWDDLQAGAFLADEDGALLFGTSGGLARYNPAEDVHGTREELPRTVITSVTLGGKERLPNQWIRVPKRDNTLNIEFAALTYRDASRLRCNYRLQGLETEINESNVREVRYPALPDGDYRFEVSCRTADGTVTAPAAYAFSVAPAWWQRWETQVLAIALGLLAIAGIVHLRLRHFQNDRRRLEAAVAARSVELAAANLELKEASLTDPLTSCRNRRYFELIIHPDITQTVRAHLPAPGRQVNSNRDLVFYLIDIDHFKQINDEYGHAAGDRLLVDFAQRISSVIRQSDVLIRWGGEEFLLISRSADRAEAMTLATRVLSIVGEEPYGLPGAYEPVYRTCSVGWAPFPWFPEEPELITYERILKMADRALYRAKQDGRNRAFGTMPQGKSASSEAQGTDTLDFEWVSALGPVRAAAADPKS